MQPSAKPESKPRRMLSDVVHEKLRAGHYSRRTEEAYLSWIRRFIKFHGGRHPRELREPVQSGYTLLRGKCKMLPPNHFRKPFQCFFGIHSTILIYEQPVIYSLLGAMRPLLAMFSLAGTVILTGCGQKAA